MPISLPELPPRIARLPKDERGYPDPSVHPVDGRPRQASLAHGVGRQA